jgi:hypothetical protein
MKKEVSKKGAILMENLIFIILNMVFLAILILFLLRQGQGAVLLEQSYAKQIALLIDSAKPGMTIALDMEKAKKLSEKNNIEFKDVVSINNNVVMVKLSEKGGYTYSFFNDVDVNAYPDRSDPSNIKNYVIILNNYN